MLLFLPADIHLSSLFPQPLKTITLGISDNVWYSLWYSIWYLVKYSVRRQVLIITVEGPCNKHRFNKYIAIHVSLRIGAFHEKKSVQTVTYVGY